MSVATNMTVCIIEYCLEHATRENKSYCVWASEEIIRELQIMDESPPLPILENFRDKMAEYETYNPQTKIIFQTARLFTDWVINLLIA